MSTANLRKYMHSKIKEIAETVFGRDKSLRVLQKACIKIMTHAIYFYIHISYKYTLLFCWKIKSCCDWCFPQQIIPQNTAQLNMLQDYSSVRIGFNMISKCHSLLVVYTITILG